MCDVQVPEQNSILRIKSVTESKLIGLQSGFRSGRTTTEEIMALRFLIDAARTQMHSLTVAFVDNSKALDTVNGRAIQVVLRHYGVPDTVVADVMQLYHSSTQQSRPASDLLKRSMPTVVFYKGIPCRLTFIQPVDYILIQSLVDEDGFTLKPANGRRYPAVTLTALAYADDYAITSESASSAESTLCRLQFHSEARGFKLNAAKTKILHVGYESEPEPIWP